MCLVSARGHNPYLGLGARRLIIVNQTPWRYETLPRQEVPLPVHEDGRFKADPC